LRRPSTASHRSDVDEAWVAIITITVGEGGLQRLQDQMVYFGAEAVLAS
jgi:hypothetical protein